MKSKIPYSTFLVLLLVVSSCSTTAHASEPTSTATPAALPQATVTTVPPATPTALAVVNVGQNATLGSFLVDTAGMTLFTFTNDSPGTSTCYDPCASFWPPLFTNGAPLAGMGVNVSYLGTTDRTDGSVQVTYNGWPLYYFGKDKVAGDTLGEGVKSTWFVINPAGMVQSATQPSATATIAPSTSGNG